ncbi:hypothetical protein EVAR_2931_1 [Eumeta japonica]|uniref:Uncharacterized protein n=1 Tax=Eumeta variegata TaxID=151549 RepID=A0A4C1T3J1_EUMVA|nr:hypothetical protein EVAR_2931_1 [Eumeta japonica]
MKYALANLAAAKNGRARIVRYHTLTKYECETASTAVIFCQFAYTRHVAPWTVRVDESPSSSAARERLQNIKTDKASHNVNTKSLTTVVLPLVAGRILFMFRRSRLSRPPRRLTRRGLISAMRERSSQLLRRPSRPV